MALPFSKDLEKYKDVNEDELLNKLTEEELKQLECALEELDPEVGEQMSGQKVLTCLLRSGLELLCGGGGYFLFIHPPGKRGHSVFEVLNHCV